MSVMSSSLLRFAGFAAAGLLLAACGASAPAAETAQAAAESAAPSPPPVYVDSILPIEEELRRFRTTAGAAPAGLEPAARSRDELVRGFVRAVERQDTAYLRDMLMDRAEFAYLYYPHSEFVRPPMQLAPDLVWMQFQMNGQKGIVRALRRRGGRDSGYTGYECGAAPKKQGGNTIWDECVLKIAVQGDTVRERWFGSIVERDGRFKFVSYANRF